jgi:phage gp36-like protein
MSYAALTDIFQRWGEVNVREAANFNSIDPASGEVTQRIEYFLELATNEIESRLLGCTYDMPFNPVPAVINTICCEMAYILMYRVRHSTDSTSPDQFAFLTARHDRIFSDIHARRFRLGKEKHTIDIPGIVGVNAKVMFSYPSGGGSGGSNLTKIYTDDTLSGDGTQDSPLSVVSSELSLDLPGVDISTLDNYTFVAINENGVVPASEVNTNVIGIKVGSHLLTRGVIANNAWNWIPGGSILLSESGLSQEYIDGFPMVRVGIALSPTQIILKFEYGFT